MTFAEWAIKWNVPAAALEELRALYVPSTFDGGSSEASTQARLRVDAPKLGAALWRNNNGACMAAPKEGDPERMIRYGLGNDSKKLNDVWKSSDLIGITPVTVRPELVGKTVGVFTAVEVKHPGWTRPANDRDRAQEAFLISVLQLGGIGRFVTHENQYTSYIMNIRGAGS